MSNQLQIKGGAQSSKPVRFAPMWTNRLFQGIWTQRSPLRDAGSTRIEESFYGTRGDALIDGLNCEISPSLTFVRRPGLSVYNSLTYPAGNRFYDWHLFTSSTEKIKVLMDSASAIYNVTAADATNTPVFTKSAGAGSAYFQSVGNNLYFSDGVDSQKIVGSLVSWAPSTVEPQGTYIIDTNGNIQVAIGSQTTSISYVQIVGTVATLFLSAPLDIPVHAHLNLGTITIPGYATQATALSNTTQTITGVPNSQQVQFTTALTPFGYTGASGSVTTGTGQTGTPTHPTWASGLGAVTQDNTAQWLNKGSQVENWGIAAPLTAPTVTSVAAPNTYPAWVANTWYAPLFIISDSGGYLQQLTSIGSAPHQTGGSAPSWNHVTNGTTTDGNITWTCLGLGAWAPSTVYTVGTVIQVSFTYYVTTYTSSPYPPYYVLTQTPYTITDLFECTTGGTSAPNPPEQWNAGYNSNTNDGVQVVWTNQSKIANWPGATQILSLDAQILDVNKNLQTPQFLAESGASSPTWNTTVGGYTADSGESWLNNGPYAAANTGAWIYAYSYVNSVTDTVSTADPQSAPITPSAGYLPSVQGVGSSDPQVDQIYIWRTVQGGSQLFYLDTVPNTGGSVVWTYIDTTPDTGLDEFIEAPTADANDPPPTGLAALTYHLGRVWGAVSNSVYFSSGPDVTVGNGDEAWPPANVFVFPDTVNRLYPTPSGLMVFTAADVYILQGLGTAASPFFASPFLQYLGLLSYDAFAVNGGTVYMYTSDNQLLCLDPSSGVSEVGFPIGDQFGPSNGTFTPTSTHVTWHVAGSQDKGLYVSDASGTWWRMCPTPAPEAGTITWSPKAQPIGGFSAVQSIEVVPGTHNLLVGPKTTGPILKRDYSVYSDNGVAYNAFAVMGSLVLAQPGQIAMVEMIVTDSQARGTPPTLAVQLDEIAPISSGYFESLTSFVPDPPQNEPSLSTYAQRFYLSQTQQVATCRHMQIEILWGTDTVKNELLSITVYAGFEQDK